MKKRNLFMSLTLMCGLFCFAFTFNSKGIHWLWSEHKPGVFILAIITVIFGALWIRTASQLKKEKQNQEFIGESRQ
jgi:hypothetical protein